MQCVQFVQHSLCSSVQCTVCLVYSLYSMQSTICALYSVCNIHCVQYTVCADYVVNSNSVWKSKKIYVQYTFCAVCSGVFLFPGGGYFRLVFENARDGQDIGSHM